MKIKLIAKFIKSNKNRLKNAKRGIPPNNSTVIRASVELQASMFAL